MLEKTEDISEKIIFHEPMKKHTSFKIGGEADLFFIAKTIEDLKEAIKYAKEKNIPIYIIGNGTNLLITDKGIRGIVIKIDIQNLEIKKRENFVEATVGAGNKMMALAQIFAQNDISGFEELSGIPGTIGGAIYMNAGAYGKEMKEIVISTTYMDYNGKIFEMTNDEQKFSYRSSIFNKKEGIILSTKLKLNYGKKEEIQEKIKEYLKKRKEKQPIEYPSAGSSFKRKEGIITSKLIDECGLKGFTVGGAKISEKHAGFIINFDNASAKDVIKLIKIVKEKIFIKYNIKIEEELKIIGEE